MRSVIKCVAVLWITSMYESEAHAWNAPDGPAIDQATLPPTGLVTKAHGYLIQTGIDVLYNDGYWFAAQKLMPFEQELLNGARYADVYQGEQSVDLQVCAFYVACQDLYSFKHWGYAADNHYFNPNTGAGLRAGYLQDLATWAPYFVNFGVGLSVNVAVNPPLANEYPSALVWFSTEYSNATAALLYGNAPSIGGRQGMNLSMFYLGWASHFVQDLTVVHHTFDEVLKNHNEYEASADGYITSRPIANGEKTGIYADQLSTAGCVPGSRTCFASSAAYWSQDQDVLYLASQETYAIADPIVLAQSLQAGLYAAYLTDIGEAPVHMSAVMAALQILN